MSRNLPVAKDKPLFTPGPLTTSMTVKQAVGLLVCLGVVAPAGAAAQVWLPAACDIKPGHYLVNSGTLYLKSAATTKFEDQRTKDLKDANRVLTQAVTSGGQEKNAAAWYYFGRYYLMSQDLVGADSAFTKALALAPLLAAFGSYPNGVMDASS